MKKLNATAIESSPVKIKDEEGYDVLFTRTLQSGEQYISRSSILKSGDNYVVVTVMSSKAEYEKNAETIYHILTNWEMQ